MNIFTIIAKGQQALAVLKLLEPVLGDNSKLVGTILEVVGKALTGAKFGANSYEVLAEQLDAVITDLETIKARGGATSADFRDEVAAIDARGAEIDAIMARLKS